MNLVSYSSSDSDEETQRKNTEVKRVKLSPVKIQLKNDVTSTEQINSNETDRIRLFPHERGNWALSIYSFVDCSSHLDTLIDDLVELFNQQHDNLWKRLVELHISLSKTIPIRFHHIESIRQGIQTEFATTKISFATRIQSISILNNEDQSTSFLVFTLDQHQEFVKLVSIIDKVLQVHRYPGYYENPCFHISFAYSADKTRNDKLPTNWKDQCQSILKQYQCQPSATTIIIDDIRLKAGKRVYSLTKSC